MMPLPFIFFLLIPLVAPPVAYAVDLEARCVELGSECVCNETMDADDGPQSGIFNPSASSTKECNGGNAMDILGSPAGDFVTGSSAGMSGTPFVFRVTTSGFRGRDTQRTFTNGTWCGRYYTRYEGPGVWGECSDPCNIKGPRNEDGNDEPGMQSEFLDSPNKLRFGTPTGGDEFGQCLTGGGGGPCTTGNKWPISGDTVTFDEMQTGWARVEWCFDHNASGQTACSGGTNCQYMRSKITMITGASAGQVMLAGQSPLAYAETGHTPINSGSTTRIWSSSTPGGGPAGGSGDVDVAYLLIAIRAAADPSFWIGAASELEGAAPATGLAGGSVTGGSLQ